MRGTTVIESGTCKECGFADLDGKRKRMRKRESGGEEAPVG